MLQKYGVECRVMDPASIEGLRDWDGRPLSLLLRDELKREQQRLALVEDQLDGIGKNMRGLLRA